MGMHMHMAWQWDVGLDGYDDIRLPFWRNAGREALRAARGSGITATSWVRPCLPDVAARVGRQRARARQRLARSGNEGEIEIERTIAMLIGMAMVYFSLIEITRLLTQYAASEVEVLTLTGRVPTSAA